MKFVKRKTFEYQGLSGILTSLSYVTLKDVEAFHGQIFAKKWLEFINKTSFLNIDSEKSYYYIDYEFAARQTDSFLNPVQ